MVTMADQATPIMAAMPLLTADTTVEVMPPNTTADIDRVTTLPAITVPGTMALGTNRDCRYRLRSLDATPIA